jgi:hypothetical protein
MKARVINRLYCIALFALAVPRSEAEVTRIEITEREIVADGFAFGSGGQYYRIVGKVYYALDPRGKVNAAIRDLNLAETNDQGRVTFSGTFFLLRPRETKRSNGTLPLEISNRGGKGMLSRFCYGPPEPNPRARRDLGDGWLLE